MNQIWAVWAGVLFLLMGLQQEGRAQVYANAPGVYSRAIKKRVPMQPGAVLKLSNKYGPVVVRGWERNVALVEVYTEVRASGEARARQVFERVGNQVSALPQLVTVSTVLAPKETQWWSWGAMEPEDYSIALKVTLPHNVTVQVSNEYGDVDISEIEGLVNLQVRQGNINCSALGGLASINLQHGHIRVDEAGQLSANLLHTEAWLENIGTAEIHSRYTVAKAEDIGVLTTNTRYDTYRIKNVGTLQNTGKYDELDVSKAGTVTIHSSLSKVFLSNIGQYLKVEMDSSSVFIGGIEQGLEQIDLNGRFTDFHVQFEQSAPFRLDAKAQYAGIRYPKGLKVHYEKEAPALHEVKGEVGSSRLGAALRARLSYGALLVEQED
ncbi:hypothetical protein [Phaeodactylibacter luteus]|uniref:DUF4097 domain-containing protein n=1 Tax=Phaeodactylibacter luteus TaxID=1564516 RepID=A0A5C6RMU7_9BACT|nr:hypothetical protein [Phaeodactylibacter luteus]TXB63285.1 hypothetical protein FRY97_09910 [Phaeodactylibacter luteus]